MIKWMGRLIGRTQAVQLASERRWWEVNSRSVEAHPQQRHRLPFVIRRRSHSAAYISGHERSVSADEQVLAGRPTGPRSREPCRLTWTRPTTVPALRQSPLSLRWTYDARPEPSSLVGLRIAVGLYIELRLSVFFFFSLTVIPCGTQAADDAPPTKPHDLKLFFHFFLSHLPFSFLPLHSPMFSFTSFLFPWPWGVHFKYSNIVTRHSQCVADLIQFRHTICHYCIFVLQSRRFLTLLRYGMQVTFEVEG